MTTISREITARARWGAQTRYDQFGAPTPAVVLAVAVVDILRSSEPLLAERFAASGGLVNVSASGETTWHGFAMAIVEGLKARGLPLYVQSIQPILTQNYPIKARRPTNSRFELSRLKRVFGIDTPRCDEALAEELDQLAFALTNYLPGQ